MGEEDGGVDELHGDRGYDAERRHSFQHGIGDELHGDKRHDAEQHHGVQHGVLTSSTAKGTIMQKQMAG